MVMESLGLFVQMKKQEFEHNTMVVIAVPIGLYWQVVYLIILVLLDQPELLIRPVVVRCTH